MPPEKRRPIAADYALSALANQHHYHPKAMEQIRRGLISSRKFVLDEEAARLIAKVVLEIPDLIVREHQFARPPFEVTSIEYPSWAFWETLRGDNPVIYDAAGEWGSLDTADHTVCYLFDHGRVNTFAHGKLGEPNAGTMLTPLQYRLHTEWSLDDQLEFARRSGCSRLDWMPPCGDRRTPSYHRMTAGCCVRITSSRPCHSIPNCRSSKRPWMTVESR